MVRSPSAASHLPYRAAVRATTHKQGPVYVGVASAGDGALEDTRPDRADGADRPPGRAPSGPLPRPRPRGSPAARQPGAEGPGPRDQWAARAGSQAGRSSVRASHSAGGAPACAAATTPPTMAQVVSTSPPAWAVVQKARS